ncbi:MAG: Adaptive-response sensory-kinase SasA [Anaerolineales bacterium]|nr:Adaptive-response sensory-kinase SasA [Anaerolineales bacterium]
MFSSLRSRLWATYVALVVTALSVVAFVLLVYLWQNPLVYREAYTRVQAAQKLIMARSFNALDETDRNLLDWTADNFEVRALIYAPNGNLLRDTLPSAASIRPPGEGTLRKKAPVLRDADGNLWIYSSAALPDGNMLVVAAPRPRVAGFSVFADELLPFFFAGGVIALLLSLVLAFVIARWVADPLQKMLAAARALPSEEIQPIEPRGPREVQEVMRAFNSMTRRVQASQRSQREFIANVSHELRTPLTSIQGFAQAILDGAASTPEARYQAAQVIQTEAARMHRMALDLLDLARLDAGTANLTMSPLDVTALLNGMTEKFAPLAEQAGVTISATDASLPTIMGDGDRLAQVFTNLVENALKFTPAGGEIILTARAAGQDVEIDIADTGEGIPAEALKRIFERFYQADASRSRQERQGAGLGLAIAREIVAAHSGKISVRSQLGQGTVFTVSLPVSQPAASITQTQR